MYEPHVSPGYHKHLHIDIACTQHALVTITHHGRLACSDPTDTQKSLTDTCDSHAAELERLSIKKANLQEVDDAKVDQYRLGLGPIPRDCQSRNADAGPIPAPPAVQPPHGPCGIVGANAAGDRLVGCKQPVILTAAASITPIAGHTSMLTVCGKKLLILTASSNRTSITPITIMHKHCSSIVWYPKSHTDLALDNHKFMTWNTLSCRQVMDCDDELRVSVVCVLMVHAKPS